MTTTIRLVWHSVVSHIPIFKTPGLPSKISKQPPHREGKGLSPLLRPVTAAINTASPLETSTNLPTMCVITFSLPCDFWSQRGIDILKGKQRKLLKVLTTLKAMFFFFLLLYACNYTCISTSFSLLQHLLLLFTGPLSDFRTAILFILPVEQKYDHVCTTLTQLLSHTLISSCSLGQFVHSASPVCLLSVLV